MRRRHLSRGGGYTFGIAALLAAVVAMPTSPPADPAGIQDTRGLSAGRVAPAVKGHHQNSMPASRLPLYFEANRGQGDPGVRFLGQATDYALFFTDRAVAIAPRAPHSQNRDDVVGQAMTMPLRMELVGTNPHPRVRGLDRMPGTVNYLRGHRSSDWISNVPTYGRILYENISPGVDAVFYENQRRLEYDFLIAPGADLDDVGVTFRGHMDERIDSAGNLILRTPGGEVVHLAPRAFQVFGGVRHEIPASYVLETGRVRFSVPTRDPLRPLVIDPVLEYSTYLGGSSGSEIARDIAVDHEGNAYVTGSMNSPGFTTTPGSFQPESRGGNDAFVAKLDPTGKTLVYATYLGGSVDDQGYAIEVDSSGSAYIAGHTGSADFPTVGPYQAVRRESVDLFIAKLNPSGSALQYSTFLGADRMEFANAIAVDASGSAYVTGFTDSWEFPNTDGALHPPSGALGTADVFLVKMSASGSTLIYSARFGGTEDELGQGVAVDSSGNAYVAGIAGSLDFPTTAGSAQTQRAGGDSDAFVVKITPSGSDFAYSTLIGAEGSDYGLGVAVDSSGGAHVVGLTSSQNFPVANAIQPANAGGTDGFVATVNPTGTGLTQSTYLGGAGEDRALAVDIHSSGSIFVAGRTNSRDFPTLDPIQATLAGETDLFVVKMTASGTLGYSTYLGGTSKDATVAAVDIDSEGGAYLTGDTDSSDFAGAKPSIGKSMFVVKIADRHADYDVDDDGLTEIDETRLGTDLHDSDSDDDGLPDGPEVVTHMTNPLDPDTDGDGLEDGAEVLTHGSDPRDPDTDGDLFGDGAEVQGASDPRNPCSVPTPVGPLTLVESCASLPT